MPKQLQLSEAIRLGAMLRPQGLGAYLRDGKSCALGAALEAVGTVPSQLESAGTTLGEIIHRWSVAAVGARCPRCRGSYYVMTVVEAIVHLNDHHHWSREEIADWVATYEKPTDVVVTEPEVAGVTV
jgi:hypothetical protein